MSVQEKIDKIKNAKADIASAIAEKGVEVPANAMLDDMADLIRLIKAGSSVSDEIILTMASVDPTVFVVSGGTVSFNYLPNTSLIVWGDGTMDEYDPSTTSGNVTHTYAATGIYTVKIYGATTIPQYFGIIFDNGIPSSFPTWLLEAKIGDTVTTIEMQAFGSCSKLYKFEFGAGVTSLAGEGIFQSCSMLTEISIPNVITGIGSIGAGSSLKRVYFSNQTPPQQYFTSNNPFGGGYAIVPEEYATSYKNKWHIPYIAYYNKTIMTV